MKTFNIKVATLSRKVGAFTFALAFAFAPVVPALATAMPSPYGDEAMKKIVLCHWDASAKPDPAYKSSGDISVNAALSGHDGHAEDIIPPFNYDVGDTIAFYPGKNWTTQNAILWNNGACDGGAVAPKSIDLAVVKTADDSTPDIGQTVIYTITVSNAGPDTATNVVVTDTLPAGESFVSADNGGTGNPVTWNIASLANGASVALHVTVLVTATGTGGNTITNTASVTGTETDSNLLNNSTNKSVVVNIDVCPNIQGNQASLPEGKIFSNGNCVPIPPPPVLGCMDPVANNYNPSATQDNGSCTYTQATGTLIVKKVIVGGSAATTSFSFLRNGIATTSFEADGQNDVTVPVGTYTVTEVPPVGYTSSYSNCTAVAVVAGQSAACVITNTVIPVDVCPNISGIQVTVPQGMVKNSNGQCVPVVIPPPTNTCLAPSNNGDVEPFTINDSGETTVQQILNNEGYSINSQSDQINTQTWNLSDITAGTVTFKVKVIGQYAGYSQQFGYYVAGSSTSFVAIPVSNNGVTVDVTVPASVASSMGFADQVNGSTIWYSQKALNTDGNLDHVAVYNPAANTYVVAFEDLSLGDKDHNDLVVKITAVTCVPPTTVDMCPNLEGAQTSIPQGYQVNNDGQCVLIPAPQQCSVTVVSDTSNTVDEKGGAAAKVVTFIHGAWTAVVSGATWIWGDDPVANPAVETIQTFTKTFNWNGPVTSAALNIAADNNYSVTLNGTAVGSDTSAVNFGSADTLNIASAIQQGTNTLKFTVTNLAVPGETNPLANPAGLLYKAVVTGSDSNCGTLPVISTTPETPSGGGGGGGCVSLSGSCGNNNRSHGGGGGGGGTSGGQVLGASDSHGVPEVAGAQTAILPSGAPNTGAGGTQNTAASVSLIASFMAMLAGVAMLRRKSA